MSATLNDQSAPETVSKNDTPVVPDKSATPADRALMILAVLAVAGALYVTRALLLPIVLALVLAMLFRPVVRRMQRWHVPAAVSAGLVLVGLVGFGGLGVYKLIDPASAWIAQAPGKFAEVEYKLRSFSGPMSEFRRASQQVEEFAENDDGIRPLQVEIKESRLSKFLLSSTADFVAGAVVSLVLLFFLLAMGDRFLNNVVSVCPTLREKRHIVEVVRNVEHGVSSYLLTVTTINACLGIAIGTAMWLLGLPNPALWGAMAGTLNFVPYLGATVGATVVFLVAVLTFDNMAYAALVPAAYGTINLIEGCFLTPAILGRSMSLNPILVFVSLTFWGWMWGVGGALLAVPLLAIAKIICDHVERYRSIGVLLGR